jgi:hypothetical protein
MRSFSRTCALVAVAAGGTALACSDPEFNTDLSTQGPPEVTIVTVLSESLGEASTFCIQGKETNEGDTIKVNRTLCPESGPGVREFAPVMDALPATDAGTPAWFVRVVFSELLDPDIERLEEIDENGDGITDVTVGHLDESQPVALRCGGVDVAYDGFYDPSGNDVTLPPGPALVINPLEYVASGTNDCQVTVNTAAKDKDGNTVADTELMGPHLFGIAPMNLALSPTTGAPRTQPANMSQGVNPLFQTKDPAGNVVQGGPRIVFNAPVSAASLDGQISFVDESGNPVGFTAAAIGSQAQLTLTAPLAGNTQYTITVPQANSITDAAGGALSLAEDFSFSFTTGAAP